jgi:hypothetical protein
MLVVAVTQLPPVEQESGVAVPYSGLEPAGMLVVAVTLLPPVKQESEVAVASPSVALVDRVESCALRPRLHGAR